MTASLQGKRRRLCVLVVDDYQDSAEVLALVLKLEGFEVQVATSGPAALQAADSNWPDVVLLDLGLPGMDGFEVAKQLQKRSINKMPVLIAFTGYGYEADIRRCQSEGFDCHLLKPVDPLVIKDALERIAERLGITMAQSRLENR
jgi:CheY-like chemotaxis protein